MNQKQSKVNSIVMAVAVLAICSIQPGCDDDKPTEPEEPTDYPIYFCDVEGIPQLFALYPIAGRIDSTTLPWLAREGVTVSADGRRLYLADRNEIYVIDASDYSLIKEIAYQPDGPLAVSPDNRLIAIANSGLHILSTSDYQVVFEDTLPVYHCAFSYDSKALYCAQKNTQYVYKVDLTTGPFATSSIFFEYGYPVHVIQTPDGSKLLLYLGVRTWLSLFAVYDIALDSTVFREYLVPGYGHIAVTPDGRYAFYTSPGRSATDPIGPPAFTIFDIHANVIDTIVDDRSFFSDSTQGAWPNGLVVTPDSRWLGILGGAWPLTTIYTFDIQEKQLVLRENWGWSGHTFNNISTQFNK